MPARPWFRKGISSTPLLPKSLHRQRRLLRAIGHGREGIGQIEQHVLGRAQLAGSILDRNPEAAEGLDLFLRSTGRLDHRGGEFLHALGQALQRDAGLLGDGFQQRQRLDRDAGLLRELGEIVRGIQGGFAGRDQGAERRARHRVRPSTPLTLLAATERPSRLALTEASAGRVWSIGGNQDLGAVREPWFKACAFNCCRMAVDSLAVANARCRADRSARAG